MDLHHDTTQFNLPARRDGWTPALKGRFLMALAEAGNVRLSARRCGRSAQSAYVQRRRDPEFARGWAAALFLARDHAEQVLADRALDGVEEPIFYRGEQIGTRRRFDTRLLLAHLARLDRMAEDEAAERDAGRFDELVAIVAGAEPPQAMAGEADILPAALEVHAEAAAQAAEMEAQQGLPTVRGAAGQRERKAAVSAAGDAAYETAAADWHGWFEHACAVADATEHDREISSTHPVNCVNFDVIPRPGLTLPAPSANGPNRPEGEEQSQPADHPSETVGAPRFFEMGGA